MFLGVKLLDKEGRGRWGNHARTRIDSSMFVISVSTVVISDFFPSLFHDRAKNTMSLGAINSCKHHPLVNHLAPSKYVLSNDANSASSIFTSLRYA